ncbi:outer membrane beta-barrel protein [Maribellus sediminis]|uniref:outer membrane beta-barrel protein n=1 Tax=Maribellus sediminis TaxID=2696285 RepID=UPI0014316A02|nr:outer membrane beta-barrel protein [Maribellus sediminis]
MKKKVLFTLILAVVLYSATPAQNKESEKNMVSGMRAGWHSATLVKDGAEPYSADPLNSFYVGFFNENKVAPLFNFGKGLEYFQNGLSYTGGGERILHTISVPLYLKLKVGPVYGLGGIAGNFKVSEKFSAGDYEASPKDSDKSKWFDAPVFLGAGVKIAFVSVEARYHWGLIEVRNGLKSQYLQVGAAVSF